MERRAIFLCFLSFLMFAEGVSLFTAGGLGPCLIEPEHSQQTTNDDEKKDCPTFFAGSLLISQRGFDWIKRDDNDKAVVGGFTIVLAISTIGLWLATNKLWRAGETQRDLAEDTAERQLRAYVSVEAGGSGRQRKGYRFDFRPIVTNNGLTPAEDVQILISIGLVPPLIPAGFNYELLPAPNPSKSTIGPRQGRASTVIYHRNLTISEMRKVVKGELAFHVYGMVSYRDVFKQNRRTNFSMIVFVPRKKLNCHWQYTEHHNDAT
jgi:hypothetical protein